MTNELLNKAIACLNISDVLLRNSRLEIVDDFDSKAPAFGSLTVQYKQGPGGWQTRKVSGESEESFSVLTVLYQAAFRLLPPDLPEGVAEDPEQVSKYTLVEVRAEFVAEYTLTCENLGKDAIEEFCKRNVGHNVWPYWREFAQSMAFRMRLPSIVVPFYTVPGTPEVNSNA